MHDIEPLAYMRDLLCLLPRWPRHRVLELALTMLDRVLGQRSHSDVSELTAHLAVSGRA